MTVTMTSEALGKKVGETYTGAEEAWLLAEGYAKQTGYTGVGVANTGATAVTPDKDLTSSANREDANRPERFKGQFQSNVLVTSGGSQSYNYDQGGVDNDPAVPATVDPAKGAPAGGTKVTISGDGFENSTGVTFGGTAGTSFKVVNDDTITVTAPAHAAGAVDVVVLDPNGNGTKVGGFTYA